MKGLTKRQKEVLDSIQGHIQSNGYPPTIREVGDEVGIRSTNGVVEHLLALEKKGYIKRDKTKSRGLRIVSPTTSSILRHLVDGMSLKTVADEHAMSLGPVQGILLQLADNLE